MNTIQKIICGLFIFATGCGTITQGVHQSVDLKSMPSSATVTLTGGDTPTTLVTPATLELKRKGTYVLTFSKEGYASQGIQLQRTLRGWMLFWDVFPWFPLGVVVDAVTGGWYQLTPGEVSVSLEKTNASLKDPQSIKVVVLVSSSGDLSFSSKTPVSIALKRK